MGEQTERKAHGGGARAAHDPAEPPAPRFASWEDYLGHTTADVRSKWCATKARTVRRGRVMAGVPASEITRAQVWTIVEAAHGRCRHCGSLAVEKRPTNPATGAPLPWENVARRIGTLDRRLPVFTGGADDLANLAWSCLWCNTWPSERRWGATDHGGIQQQFSAAR